MNLSNDEKKFYEDTFVKLTQNNQSLREPICRPLLNKGIGDSTISDKIWAEVSEDSAKQVLKKKDLFKLLKYIAAYQNGYQLDNIVLKDLPELSVPNLTKKKRKNRGAEIAKEPIQTDSHQEGSGLPQTVEQSPEKEPSLETSPARESVMSCPSTEEPASDRHISPEKDHQREQPITEEKTEMLTELLEKDNNAQQSLPNETYSHDAAPQKFESPNIIQETDPEEPPQVDEQSEVIAEDKVPHQDELVVAPLQEVTEDKVLHQEEPEVLEEESVVAPPQEVTEDKAPHQKESETLEEEIIMAPPQEVAGDKVPHQEESEALEEEIIVAPPQEEDLPIEVHHEELGLANQLNLIKDVQEKANDEKLQRSYDDDERRSKGSTSSIASHRSRMSFDSTTRSSAKLTKYNQFLEQNQKIKVDIRDTITYNSGFMGYGTYTTYLIRSKYSDSDTFLEAERRFSDFDWLNSYFQSHLPYKGIVFPVLPEKKSIGNNEPGFIQQRKAELDRYLKEIARHKVLSQDPILRTFLGEKGREGFQTLKEKIQVNGLSLPELDWRRVKEACEYAMASVKVKLQKDSVPNEWKESNEQIFDVLRIDGMIKKLLKTLQKREELYKTVKTMNNNLNVIHMKIMNRVEKEAYYSIGSLSSLMVAQARNLNDDAFIIENLIKHIKVFRAKVDGCKKSYALLISILQEIGTNKELHKNKQGKMFEHKAEKNLQGIATVTKELGEIEKKVESLEKETVIIKENLNLEAETLVELFDIFLPDALNFFNIQQAEQFEKVSRTWEGLSQE